MLEIILISIFKHFRFQREREKCRAKFASKKYFVSFFAFPKTAEKCVKIGPQKPKMIFARDKKIKKMMIASFKQKIARPVVSTQPENATATIFNL